MRSGMTPSRYRGTRRELYEIGKERRGRPRSNKVKIFLKINAHVEKQLGTLGKQFPQLRVSQSEMVGLGVELLGENLDRMATALGRDDRVLPAGVVDIESLYLIWNLEYPGNRRARATTVYLTPEQAVQLGSIRTRLRLQIRVSQSGLLNLGVSLLVDRATKNQAVIKSPVRTKEELAQALKLFA